MAHFGRRFYAFVGGHANGESLPVTHMQQTGRPPERVVVSYPPAVAAALGKRQSQHAYDFDSAFSVYVFEGAGIA